MKNAWTKEIDRLREVNKALLEACQEALQAMSTPGHGPKYATKILESAIAKAEVRR